TGPGRCRCPRAGRAASPEPRLSRAARTDAWSTRCSRTPGAGCSDARTGTRDAAADRPGPSDAARRSCPRAPFDVMGLVPRSECGLWASAAQNEPVRTPQRLGIARPRITTLGARDVVARGAPSRDRALHAVHITRLLWPSAISAITLTSSAL